MVLVTGSFVMNLLNPTARKAGRNADVAEIAPLRPKSFVAFRISDEALPKSAKKRQKTTFWGKERRRKTEDEGRRITMIAHAEIAALADSTKRGQADATKGLSNYESAYST